MKFSQMTYTRPEFKAASAKLSEMIAAFEQAETAERAITAYMAVDKYLEHIGTMSTLAYIRHSIDTTDEFYDAEISYFDEIGPLLQEIGQRLERALIDSPHRAALEQKFGNLMFKNIEISLKTFSPDIIPQLQQENKLTNEYEKLLASAQIEFDGKTLTLSQIRPYLENADRAVRQSACNAAAEWFLKHADKFDSLFDELTALRTGIAKKLGYGSFTELGYYRMTRNCYDDNMVAKFREGVRKYIVPIAARLKREQAARLNLDKLKVYDDNLLSPDGNEDPFGTPEEILENGRKMYRELSAETGEFIDFMMENELFDVLSRPGKAFGGYCTEIADYKSPFIFANFNGTAGDIDVLTHEAGHAFNAYVIRDREPSGLRSFTYETAEVHSMSMEFFTWPWMNNFFKNADKYRLIHLANALTFIPYGVMVDEFQHRVYENPDMSSADRNRLWLELESVYRPWLDLSDTPFYDDGRRWQSQAHIYGSPFYYIDYCLAQVVALSFWAEMQESHSVAWEKYIKFVNLTGKKTFLDSLIECGLPNPFDPEQIRGTADTAVKWLDNQG